MKHKICPECRSENTAVATGQFAGSGNQAFKNRLCRVCGTAWRPACPRWVAIALIVLGCLIPPIENGISKQFSDVGKATNNPGMVAEGHQSNWLPILLAGIAVSSGLSVLIGVTGKLKILGKKK